MKSKWIAVAMTTLLAAGCATKPTTRAEFTDLPALEDGWGRIFVTAGKMNGVKLWSVHQVGPVLINDKVVGKTAKDEHFAVDLQPGTYEIACTQEVPQKNYIEKTKVEIHAGDKRYFACDMSTKGAGASFGLIGALAAEYLTRSYLEERTFDNAANKLIGYTKVE